MTQVTIDRLGYQGDGIAQGPLYVPGTLPGETVTGTPDGQTLRDVRIDTPSSDRVKPPCVHAKSCGGCQLQHASDGFLADWKAGVVRNALLAHGIEAEIRPIETSPPLSRRRASFSARRTKKGALAGFHMKASDVVVSIPNCQLLHPDLTAALPMVEQLAVLGSSRKGELSVLVTKSEVGLDVAVTGGKPADTALRGALAKIADEHDLARLCWDDETLLRRRPYQIFGNARVTPPAGSFLQATAEGEAALQRAVLSIVDGATHVADLFSGSGTFALPIARTAAVHAVEGEKAMIAALNEGWRMAEGLRRVTCEARDLFRNPLLPEELKRFDAIVIDPPRAGAEAQVAEIASIRTPKVAHVSCNPVTFARDTATLLAAGYRLDWVQPVDQFRWSTHVELVASLSLDI
ncbi:class I SAM-dependent RNA methyltransferase [Pseudoprimorskyibacter insulae]|nr:RsmD family RNA methyltransferase [Pseudoprimorskyibacter insulae]